MTTHDNAHARPASLLTELLIDGLACFRLVKLVRDDMITEPLRRAVVEQQGPPDRSKVSYLLHCPWCLSVYFGAALTLGRRRWPRTTQIASRSLALSALTGLATQHLDRGGQGDSPPGT